MLHSSSTRCYKSEPPCDIDPVFQGREAAGDLQPMECHLHTGWHRNVEPR